VKTPAGPGPLRPVLADGVREALDAGQPVVALESTLISHGLPWPRNLEVARGAESAIRGEGAVPATVAIRDGALLVGLVDADLEALARAGGVPKTSRQNLAAVLGRPGWGATTVSATMIAAHLAGIRVFATGGIGGVHRGAVGGPGEAGSLDISADLDELARTPVLVVCSGPKSILDAGLTLEYLETRGVPVVGLGTDQLPGFWACSSGFRVPIRCDGEAEAARLALRHWGLGLGSGVVVAVPVPEEDAVSRGVADAAIERAIREARAAGVHGPAMTPWLLARIAELTGGRSVRANVSLIVNNARAAARMAVAMGRGAEEEAAPA
jgi:pseudouridine-5'-phosphate glycosidase